MPRSSTPGARVFVDLFLETCLPDRLFGFMHSYIVTREIVMVAPSFRNGYCPCWIFSAPYCVVFSSPPIMVYFVDSIVAFAILGLSYLRRGLPEVGVPFLAAAGSLLLFHFLLPGLGGHFLFGNRFFVSLTPLFIFGLGLLLELVARQFSSQRDFARSFVGLLTCFGSGT